MITIFQLHGPLVDEDDQFGLPRLRFIGKRRFEMCRMIWLEYDPKTLRFLTRESHLHASKFVTIASLNTPLAKVAKGNTLAELLRQYLPPDFIARCAALSMEVRAGGN